MTVSECLCITSFPLLTKLSSSPLTGFLTSALLVNSNIEELTEGEESVIGWLLSC